MQPRPEQQHYAGSGRHSGGVGAPPSAGRPAQVSGLAVRPHTAGLPRLWPAAQRICPSLPLCRPQHFTCAAPQRRAAGRQLAVSVRAEGV